MAKSSKSLIFVSDMHVMSALAVNPEPKNEIQSKLLDCWDYCIDARSQKTHLLFLNGEPIDGQNPKGLGVGQTTTDWLRGLEESKLLLEKYKSRHFMLTAGSGYHIDEKGIPAEEILARLMKSKPYRAYSQPLDEGKTEFKDGKRVDHFAWIECNDVLFSITHHIGFNRWFSYKTTALAREMAEVTLARDKWLDPQYLDMTLGIIRSHVHYFVGVNFSNSFGFTTPAWKFPDPHLLRSGIGGTMPTIGSVEVLVEGDGTYSVHPHIIKSKMLPKVNVVKV